MDMRDIIEGTELLIVALGCIAGAGAMLALPFILIAYNLPL